MKKRLVLVIIMVLFAVMVLGFVEYKPNRCPNCGSFSGTYPTSHVDVEQHNAPCTHGKFGGDHVTVTYNVTVNLCNACHQEVTEYWQQNDSTVTCNGWTVDDYRR